MDPQPVPGLQVGNLRNGQRQARTLHSNLDLRSDEIERIFGAEERGTQKQKKEERRRPVAAGQNRTPQTRSLRTGIKLTDARSPAADRFHRMSTTRLS